MKQLRILFAVLTQPLMCTQGLEAIVKRYHYNIFYQQGMCTLVKLFFDLRNPVQGNVPLVFKKTAPDYYSN